MARLASPHTKMHQEGPAKNFLCFLKSLLLLTIPDLHTNFLKCLHEPLEMVEFKSPSPHCLLIRAGVQRVSDFMAFCQEPISPRNGNTEIKTPTTSNKSCIRCLHNAPPFVLYGKSYGKLYGKSSPTFFRHKKTNKNNVLLVNWWR